MGLQQRDLTVDEQIALIKDVGLPMSREIGRPLVGGTAPTESVMRAVRSLLQHPAMLEHGDFLTTIHRFGGAWQNTILEYVCQTKPYNIGYAKLEVYSTILNISARPVNIVVASREMPVPVNFSMSVDGYAEAQDLHRIVTKTKVLAPGDTIELIAERAVPMLRRYAAQCRTPDEQIRTSKPTGDYTCREVAYRATWQEEQESEDGFDVVERVVYSDGHQNSPKRQRKA